MTKKKEQEDYEEFESMLYQHEAHVIEDYKKEKQEKAKKVLYGVLNTFNALIYLAVSVATFIFVGILYMAFYQTGTLEVLKIWFLPLIMAGVASMLLFIHFISEVAKNEK